MASSVSSDARRRANLRVLQRLDPLILDIAGSATHVVLYEFNTTSQQWEKTGCEGSLFVAKRSEVPRFTLVVLNRSSKDNLEVPITGKFQMQLQEPYLIFREAKGDGGTVKIRGIWFHDGAERTAVSDLLSRLVTSLEQIEQLEENHAHDAEALLGTDKREHSAKSSSGKASKDTAAKTDHHKNNAVEAGNTATSKQPPHVNNLVLDKKSLQLSLLSLIQDERFLDLIHAQYLKVAHARGVRDKHGNSAGDDANNNG
mmetsp:Transcript_35001/g.76559  ORF Transcript_35001/g.76559 Transcript_35001/m.76559 type:complete len:257 (-) Transcript_35001:69-839(-)